MDLERRLLTCASVTSQATAGQAWTGSVGAWRQLFRDWRADRRWQGDSRQTHQSFGERARSAGHRRQVHLKHVARDVIGRQRCWAKCKQSMTTAVAAPVDVDFVAHTLGQEKRGLRTCARTRHLLESFLHNGDFIEHGCERMLCSAACVSLRTPNQASAELGARSLCKVPRRRVAARGTATPAWAEMHISNRNGCGSLTK